MKIDIIPLGEVEKTILETLVPEIKEKIPSLDKCNIGRGLEIPDRAYDPDREQFEASKLIEHVSSKHKDGGDKTLAVTEKDLFSRDLNFVFGQARRPGKMALVSMHRLKPEFYNRKEDRKLYLERAVKEAVHEIGHTLGLGHCNDRKCVMSFSNSIADVDKKSKSFCERCRKRLSHAT